jgi:hypothetical protein
MSDSHFRRHLHEGPCSRAKVECPQVNISEIIVDETNTRDSVIPES